MKSLKGKGFMRSEAWRKDFTFVTITVPMRGQDFLARFNRKVGAEGFSSKAELYRALLKKYLDGEYKGLDLLEHGTVKGSEFTTLSMFYPKEFEVELKKRLAGKLNKTVVLRGLIMAWFKDVISVEAGQADSKGFRFATVKLSTESNEQLEREMKKRKAPYTKPELVLKLVKKYVTSAIKVDAQREKPGDIDSGFSVQVPVELDDALVKKMEAEGLKFKTTLLRRLVEEFIDGKIKIK